MRFDAVHNSRVEIHRRNMLKDPNYLMRVGERAEPFMYMVLNEIERRGMPTELALLPVIESAYDPHAYSRAHASGLWQFIPETGKHYGLRQDFWYDGRRDVVASTNAALDYLQKLNEMFDGDWLCALAAYNAGEGRVSRAIKSNIARNRPTDYWSLDLPEETRNYVPKLLALSEIVRNNDGYGVNLPPIADEPRLAMVDTRGQIDLSLAARIAGLPVEELLRYNPGFSRWATAPEGPHNLLLPLSAIEQFERTLLQLKPDERLSWTRHKVKRGETLAQIAQKYQTDAKLVADLNQIRNGRLTAGKSIIVPVSTEALPGINARQLLASDSVGRATQAERQGRRASYKVRKGDTLSHIAKNHRVSVNDLMAWNNLSKRSRLSVGQNLVIYPGSSKAPARTAVASSKATTYKVNSGDSLYLIAKRFSVSVQDLRRWNDLSGDGLQPGQTLRVHVN
ncbi:MAG: LysM peptidoglycan-binding domain-containing protein [Gammaproteobacteria bacterium]|nr:LysM peptidoglycan-binding domain-containing protein [Gammaproteobacteria bacterium]